MSKRKKLALTGALFFSIMIFAVPAAVGVAALYFDNMGLLPLVLLSWPCGLFAVCFWDEYYSVF